VKIYISADRIKGDDPEWCGLAQCHHSSLQEWKRGNYIKGGMSISTVFTTAPKWKQPKCPPMDKWINKMLSVYTMEYDLAYNGMKHYAGYNLNGPLRHYGK
jgi:hypothetical protein